MVGSDAAVSCTGLCKRYGRQRALAGLDLEVPRGTLFGLLGPNGAGKSTTLRILAGLIRAQSGSARLFGVDVRRHVAAARNTAFLIENAVFPAHLSARDVLRRTAWYAGVPYDETPLERVGLGDARRRRAGGFSHGMRQRLGLACALLGSPDLLVLDEPQNGLDPLGLAKIRTILREEHARGATVFVSVHRLAEVEGLCTHAAIVVSGRTLRAGPVETLLDEKTPRHRMVVDDFRAAEEALRSFRATRRERDLLIEGDADVAAAAAAACVRAGVKVFELAPFRKTLDEVYLNEVRRA